MSEAINSLNVITPSVSERFAQTDENLSVRKVDVEQTNASQLIQKESEKIEQEKAVKKELEQKEEQAAVEEVASKLQEFVNLIDKKLQFSVDEDSGRQVVRVTDNLSGDVIRQIPSEEVLRLARNLSDLAETANRSGKLIITEV
jgi:flagellar protein FlaG